MEDQKPTEPQETESQQKSANSAEPERAPKLSKSHYKGKEEAQGRGTSQQERKRYMEYERLVTGFVLIWHSFRGNLPVIFSGLILAVTVTYTWYASRQWQATTDQVSIMKQSINQAQIAIDQSKLAQRAWIGVKEINANIKGGETTEVKIIFLNSGTTPAVDVHQVVEITLGPFDRAPMFTYTEAAQEGMAVLVPSAETYITINTPVFTKDEITTVKKGQRRLYVGGTVWYRDVITRASHETEFCFFFDYKSQTPNACKTGNKAN